MLYKAAKETGEVLPGVRVFKIGSSMRVSRIQLDEFLGRPHEHAFGYSPGSVEPMSPEGLEQLRRSIVMLSPGDRSGLDRETALALLQEVHRLKEGNRRHTELVEALRALVATADRPSA